jgi:hypothetical protein
MWLLDLAGEDWTLVRSSDDHRVAPVEGGSNAPSPRYTPVLQSIGQQILLFSGYTEDSIGKRNLNDAWIYESGHWIRIEADVRQGYDCAALWPGERYGSMSAADGNAAYVCGGFSSEGDHIDVWRFSMVERKWSLLCPDMRNGPAPEPRYCAVLAIYGRKLYLFGGRSRKFPKRNFNDLWIFDLDRAIWSEVHGNRVPHRYDESALFPAYHAKSASAVAGKHLYIWGGEGLHGHVSDFWRLHLDSCEWQQINAARSDDPAFW